MSLTNIQRDSFWADLEETIDVQMGTTFTPIGALTTDREIIMNADATVQPAVAKAKLSKVTAYTVPAASYGAFGCYMAPPKTDAVPYRVKAYAHGLQSPSCALGVGYAEASPNGVNDVLYPCIILPFDDKVDDIVIVPKIEDTDPLYGRAIGFAILVGECTSDIVLAQLSVQRLATSPPQFAQSTP